jgi:rieske iron-sulfur protein
MITTPQPLVSQQGRRKVIRIAVAGAAAGCAPLAALAQATAANRPRAGDLLVADDVESNPVGLKAADVLPGKPLLAFPFDPGTKQIRNDSRLNKIVLVRLAAADMDADTKARAAGGVVAYSAMCTHQNCDVKTWIAADKSLVCFCHSSKFLPAEGGRVSAGPAPRALPALALSLKGDQLVVAGSFSTNPGGTA